MNDLQLINNAIKLSLEADQVISNTKFYALFSKLGKVSFVGSYALGLLFRRDIDVYVTNSSCLRSEANMVTEKLLSENMFQTIGFADWTKHITPEGQKGYYWELIYYFQGEKWKFDVWYTDHEAQAIESTRVINEKLILIPDAKLKILRLKQELYDGNKYKDGMNGYKIYEKVLGKIY